MVVKRDFKVVQLDFKVEICFQIIRETLAGQGIMANSKF